MAEQDRYATPAWQVTIYNLVRNEKCFCGKDKEHAGWLKCVERHARDLDEKTQTA